MKIAFISDIHANFPALEAVLENLSQRGVRKIYCAGDIVGYNAFPNETVTRLDEEDVAAVRGNHDEAVLKDTPSNFNIPAKRAVDWTRRNLSEDSTKYLEGLDYEMRRQVGGNEIYITHGSPKDNLNEYVHEEEVTDRRISRWFETGPDVIVLGHTHQQFTQYVGETLVVNPGSVGQPRDRDPRAAFAVFDTETGEVDLCRVEYAIEKAANRTQEVLPRKLADRLYEGR